MRPGRSLLLAPLALAVLACGGRGKDAAGADAGADGAPAKAAGTEALPVDVVVGRAEDTRNVRDLAPELASSRDATTRRRVARAYARIADAASRSALLGLLADEDEDVVAWSAYGLGFACKGAEDATVRALAARAASLGDGDAGAPRPGRLDARTATARAIGRCGGPLAEQVLVGLGASRGSSWQEATLLGLGDIATRRKQLGAEAMTLLLERALPKDGPPEDVAFYALSRADAGDAFGSRVALAAQVALARPGPYRILAVKTLGRVRTQVRVVAPLLAAVAGDAKGYEAGERAEAARALGALGERGRDAAVEALVHITPDKDAVAIQALVGPSFHVLAALVSALGAEPPKAAEPSLRVLATLASPSAPGPSLALRLAELRCSASLALARGTHDAEVLRQCDVETSAVAQHARLASLLRRPLVGERRTVFRAFAKSEHLRVREAAVEAIEQHGELGELAAEVLGEALSSKNAGLVATAAEVLHKHPERAYVLAAKEKRAALDPRAPPPTATPAQDLAPAVSRSLAGALATPWPEDRFETRIALVEAAAALRHPDAKKAALAACKDENPVMRERAQRALRTLGESVTPCERAERADVKPAKELGATLDRPKRVVFRTETSELVIVLEPDLAPVTATRIASLASSGFYKGNVVHRVVPGFVVQLGDPEADGYGGSGTPLRCETSPVPFAALDVGMALAGRDTGSSQFFVTLSRTPHLDGEYTRVGRAEGPWAAVAQGDVIVDARLVE